MVLSVSRRTINRAKKRTIVYVRGQDENGNAIEGTYGAGTDVVSFTERKATNVATLNSIAEYKYNQLNKDSSGVKLTSPIEYAYDLNPGDTVVLDRPELNLSGSYRIWRIVKKATVAEIEIDKQEELLERFLERQRGLEDVGIYPAPGANLDLPAGAPATPTGLTASNNVPLSIDLGWNENTETDLSQYQIHRNTVNSSDGSALLAKINSTSYYDPIAAANLGSYYYYWLKSEDFVGNVSASYSSVASGKAVPLATGSQLSDSIITTLKIAASAVNNSRLAVDSIYGAVIQASAITWNKIGGDAIGTIHISALSITETEIGPLSISSPKIKADAITAIKIAASAIQANHIQTNALLSRHIGADQIVAAKIAASEIQAVHIVANAIDANRLQANAVIAVKIAASAVTTSKLDAWAVTTEKLTAGQIYAKDFRTEYNVGSGVAGGRFHASGLYFWSGGNKTVYIEGDSGKLFAGEGKLIIDESGATFYGEKIIFREENGIAQGSIIATDGAYGGFKINALSYGTLTAVLSWKMESVGADPTFRAFSPYNHRFNRSIYVSNNVYADDFYGTPHVNRSILASRPGAAAGYAGALWCTREGAGTKEKVWVCMQNDANGYEWVQVAITT